MTTCEFLYEYGDGAEESRDVWKSFHIRHKCIAQARPDGCYNLE